MTSDVHILPYRTLLCVLGALFGLTGVTIAVSTIDLGWMNVWVALLIASVKSSVVLLFFMHLRYENKLFLITFLVTVFFVAVLIGLMFWDVAFRS